MDQGGAIVDPEAVCAKLYRPVGIGREIQPMHHILSSFRKNIVPDILPITQEKERYVLAKYALKVKRLICVWKGRMRLSALTAVPVC